MNEGRAALHLIVTGRVQGVWYRDWTVDTARSLGVTGWVRNRPDGNVEAWVEGGEAALRRLVSAMREGPPAARVDTIEQTVCEPKRHENFLRR